MKNVVQKIKNFIVGVLGIIYFGFVIFIAVLMINFNKYAVTEINGTTVVIVKEELSSDKYKKGDIILVESKKIDKINVEDEIFVYTPDERNKTVHIDIGVIGQTDETSNEIMFKNGKTYSMDYVIGAATKSYSKVGTYLGIIESTWGFLFVALVPSFLIFIYEFYALIVEIKYGKQEAKKEVKE